MPLIGEVCEMAGRVSMAVRIELPDSFESQCFVVSCVC